VTACSWKCSSAVTASTDSSIVCQRHHRLLQPLLPGLRAFMASGRSERPRGASVHEARAVGVSAQPTVFQRGGARSSAVWNGMLDQGVDVNACCDMGSASSPVFSPSFRCQK